MQKEITRCLGGPMSKQSICHKGSSGGGYRPEYGGAPPEETCVTPPAVLDPEPFTGEHDRYTLESSQTYTQYISSTEAADIASESAGMQAISDYITSIPITAVTSIVFSEFVGPGKAIGMATSLVEGGTTYSQAYNSNIH